MGARIPDLLQWGRRQLAAAPFSIPRREAALLLGHVLGWREASLLARDDVAVEEESAARYRELVTRRTHGEPVAYLTGEKEFFGRTFRVDPRVLIPRPETEHLVEAALEIDLPPRPRILDVGTGSGCLAVTLALEIAEARVTASDLSPAALAVAARNASRHGVRDRLWLLAADLASGLELEAFDLVVSNPPYVSPSDAATLSPEVRDFEPHLALFAPDDGHGVLIRMLAELAPLRATTPALFEIGYGQAESLQRAVDGSDFQLQEIEPDYAGIPRLAKLRRR